MRSAVLLLPLSTVISSPHSSRQSYPRELFSEFDVQPIDDDGLPPIADNWPQPYDDIWPSTPLNEGLLDNFDFDQDTVNTDIFNTIPLPTTVTEFSIEDSPYYIDDERFFKTPIDCPTGLRPFCSKDSAILEPSGLSITNAYDRM